MGGAAKKFEMTNNNAQIKLKLFSPMPFCWIRSVKKTCIELVTSHSPHLHYGKLTHIQRWEQILPHGEFLSCLHSPPNGRHAGEHVEQIAPLKTCPYHCHEENGQDGVIL